MKKETYYSVDVEQIKKEAVFAFVEELQKRGNITFQDECAYDKFMQDFIISFIDQRIKSGEIVESLEN